MTSKELIKILQELDPEGNVEVSVGSIPIFFIERLPAYYDGSLQVLIRDKSKHYYNVVGAAYKRKGDKISIQTHSIYDSIWEDPNLPIDYSELSEYDRLKAQKAHEDLKKSCKNFGNELEFGHFFNWVKKQASDLTEDLEELKGLAQEFYISNLDREDPFSPGERVKGESYISARERQWSEKVKVELEEGCLVIKKR